MNRHKYQLFNMKHNFPYNDSTKFVSRLINILIILFIFILFWLLVPDLYAEILYSNDFNDDTTGSYSTTTLYADWETGILADLYELSSGLSDVSIVADANAYEGKSLRVRYKNGKSGAGSGAVWRMWLDDDYDELYYSCWLKFESGFDFGTGIKLPLRLRGGQNPGPGRGYGPDDDGFADRFTVKGSTGTGNEGDPLHYTYHPDMPGTYGDNLFCDDGPGGQVNILSDVGEWHHIESRLVVNTPNQYDGIIQSWYDGVLCYERTNFRFRKSGDFAIDRLEFATFFSTGKPPNRDEYAYYDNIIISTHRVGSGKPPPSSPPSQPKNLRINQ